MPVNRFQFSKTDDSSLEVGGDVNFEFREQAEILFSYFRRDQVNFFGGSKYPYRNARRICTVCVHSLGNSYRVHTDASIDRILYSYYNVKVTHQGLRCHIKSYLPS